MNTDLAKQLTQNVRDFYESQGEWFATTREKIMPEHEFVKDYVRSGTTVVDIGAGNGRLAKLLPLETNYIGFEPSSALRTHGNSSLSSGALPSIPLPDQTADITVCLAVLHHIPSKDMRTASVRELIRLTKPGGIILATSWFRNPHHDRTIPVENGEPGDTWMPWTSPDNKISKRFVHFMQTNEWKELWTQPDLEIVKIGLHGKQTWTDNESEALNWRVIAKRR